MAEEFAFDFRRETIQDLGVFTHDVVHVQTGVLRMFDGRKCFERDMEVVTDTSGVDDRICRGRLATVPLMYSYMKFKIYKAWGKNKDFFFTFVIQKPNI